MTVHYRIEHDTVYRYGAVVPTSRHVACLTPRNSARQRTLWHVLEVEPLPAESSRRVDYHGNLVSHFAVLRPHRELEVRARSIVAVDAVPAPAGDDAPWEEVRDALVYRKGAPGRPEAELTFASPFVVAAREFADYAAASFGPGRPLAEAAAHLMHRMHEDFAFDAEATTVTTPVTRVLEDRRGVCQDLAHVMISCLRSLGLPARYVSGYVLTDPPPGQPRLLGADASHAWVSVHSPRFGWVDLDPTNDVAPDTRHVVVGYGRDYGDVCPLRGVFTGGGKDSLEIGVSVIPIEEQEVAAALASCVDQRSLQLVHAVERGEPGEA